MIKRNGDNVFTAAAGPSNQSPLGRSAVSLCPGPGAVSTRIPQPRAARMAPPAPAAGLALGVYVEKWKSRYEDSERKYKASVLRAEKGKGLTRTRFILIICIIFLVRTAHVAHAPPASDVCKRPHGSISHFQARCY
ncbi:hypothetical protein EVAR_81430_1 [Eumeta japonica]|uniref:Uncharacterized protein n=1 Tax=Eumeta variegata TaxID=151549 RepID=A0A4C1W0S3_EUMVA|nr:hypothetical protein EVAR_81430_1 [Eumeta japonica]